MDRVKVNLWYSERQAKKGRIYHVPISLSEDDKVAKCTDITMDREPPTDTAKFIAVEYLIVD